MVWYADNAWFHTPPPSQVDLVKLAHVFRLIDSMETGADKTYRMVLERCVISFLDRGSLFAFVFACSRMHA